MLLKEGIQYRYLQIFYYCRRCWFEINRNDLDIELIEEIDAKIEKGGSLTAPAHLVYDIVRKLPDSSEITLSKDDSQDHLTTRSGKSNFKLQTLPRSDFPEISDNEFSHAFNCEWRIE